MFAATEVCITFDVEFTIGGAFADPYGKAPIAEPAVFCNVNGTSQGLGFILDTLDAYHHNATFFVEALNHHYFGDKPMARIAQQILRRGHDIQLHLHPCWCRFRQSNWQDHLGANPPNDSMADRSEDELCELISDGIDTFKRWGIPRPVAMRTGGLHADLTIYRALSRNSIPLASNVGISIYQPRESTLQLFAGRHEIEGVLEVPILSYLDLFMLSNNHLKTLTITGSSWQEFRALLQQAHQRQAGPITILSHPSEFVKGQDLQYTVCHTNRLNQARFRQLCQFLQDHRNTYHTQTFAGAKDTWLAEGSTENISLSVPLSATIKRLVENRLNDISVWY